MNTHAMLAPSSAARWVQCAGSVIMSACYPQEESDTSREGTLAHAVASALLMGQPVPPDATEEMLDGAETYVDAIRATIPNGLPLVVESRVDCTSVHPDNWGTPDTYAIDYDKRRLYVFDYKFGHRHVEVFENWQLIDYAIGVREVARKARPDVTFDDVVLVVIQPRSYHRDGPVRSWTLNKDDALPYQRRLRDAANAAMQPDAVTTTGDECRDCPARHACPALQSAAYAAVEFSGVNIPFDMLPGALGRELSVMQSAADLLKARISGLENEVLGTIKRGVIVPGWMTEQGSGREKWARPIDEILALGEMMGVSVSKPSAITPKQAIKAGIPAAVVAGYTETPVGSVSLVRDSNLKGVFK